MMTERAVRRLVAQVCADLDPGNPPPSVVFAYHNGDVWDARYYEDQKKISMPTVAWVKEHEITTALGYREIVLHEVAHHLYGSKHTADFYCGLFILCTLYGVRLSLAYDDESAYKPRAAASGLDKYIEKVKKGLQ